jgi:hypothetical protein
MNTSDLTIEQILYQSKLRINNSLNDAAILGAVSPFGYTDVKLNEGADLLSVATNLDETQKREYGEVEAAQSAYETQRKAAHGNYMTMLAICKIAFKKDLKAKSTLDLTGRRATTISGWLKQTTGFYRAILANDEWKTALLGFGQTEKKLKEQLADVEAVSSALETKKKELGDAQNATQERDAKIEELVEWVGDYEVIARIALADKPQLLEKLGIVVKG